LAAAVLCLCLLLNTSEDRSKMASFLLLVSVAAALLPLVQGGTGIMHDAYATSDCTGAVKKTDLEEQDTCQEHEEDGVKMSWKKTCTATEVVTTYYSDGACTTVNSGAPEQKATLACSASDGAWVKRSCGNAVNTGLYIGYSAAECPAANKTGTHPFSFVTTCRANTDSEHNDGNVSWGSDKSEMVAVTDGSLVISEYGTMDCSGTAVATGTMSYVCTGVCTVHPMGEEGGWYKMTDCKDTSGKVVPGAAVTAADGSVSVPKATADSSHRMSASGAGGLVALLAMFCLAQK